MATQVAKRPEQVPQIASPRLPYHPALQEQFGVDLVTWRALVESTFPNAQTTEAVILALSYCKARKLDPLKRTVHIVPIWDSKRKCMVETVWPGIAELRTTAFRTGEYAGRAKTEFGPTIEETFETVDRDGKKQGDVVVRYPEWAQVTVKRLVRATVCEFVGPMVFWKEAYATAGRNSGAPNAMWAKRPSGQLEKVAEAAALRAAFPEELGSEYSADEVESGTFTWHGRPSVTPQAIASDALAADLAKPPAPALLNSHKIPESSQQPPTENLDAEPDPESTAEPADDSRPPQDQIDSCIVDFRALTDGCATQGELALAWNELAAANPHESIMGKCRTIANCRKEEIQTLAKRKK